VPATASTAPPAGSPDAGLIEKTIRCESSDVLPSGSVAVAVRCSPGRIVAETVTSMIPVPEPSVVT
jgi:hypothetical protein